MVWIRQVFRNSQQRKQNWKDRVCVDQSNKLYFHTNITVLTLMSSKENILIIFPARTDSDQNAKVKNVELFSLIPFFEISSTLVKVERIITSKDGFFFYSNRLYTFQMLRCIPIPVVFIIIERGVYICFTFIFFYTYIHMYK